MIEIQINIHADEVLLRLDQFPRRLREAIKTKFEAITAEFKIQFGDKIPGRFIGQERIRSGVEQIGSLSVGFLEIEEKPGTYSIYPSKARVLRFLSRSGEVVFRPRVLAHPFLNNVQPSLARQLVELKPWILDQLEDAMIEAW